MCVCCLTSPQRAVNNTSDINHNAAWWVKNTHFVQMEGGLADWRLTGVMLLHFLRLL